RDLALYNSRAILNSYLIIFDLFFFFYFYGHHQALHSFPTRRSSDLCRSPREWTISFMMRQAVVSTHPRTGVWTFTNKRTLTITRDRKSTRLNSSHRTISYAVFCLKKKKITYIVRPDLINRDL